MAEEQRTVFLAIRVTPTEKRALDSLAKLRNKSLSELVRDLVMPTVMAAGARARGWGASIYSEEAIADLDRRIG